MELKGKKINFLGDSITAGVGVSIVDNIYHQVMKRKYGLSEARNYGVSGSRFAKQINPGENEPIEWDFCYRAEQMDKDADVVVVFGGTNDFGHGDAPIGTFDDRERTTFYGACHQLFSYLMTEYSYAVIVVCTPLHRLREEKTNGDNGQKRYNYGNLKRYVEIIREVAEYYSIPVIDFYKNSLIQPNIEINRVKYIPDGLHPNDVGHAIMADRIGNFLLSY